MKTTVLDSLNAALHRAFIADERVLLLGEDVLDPYGGAFKVTRGLSSAFPGRVLAAPISEAGIVGVAGGMALRGLRPVVEVMFGDFITLAADQLINHIAKFHWMYNGQVTAPLVVRTPMGGRRGYGPTHSQTMEKIFLGAPGLRVLAPTNLQQAGCGDLLFHAICSQTDPVLFVENKLQYLLPLLDADQLSEFDLRIEQVQTVDETLSTRFDEYAPWRRLTIRSAPPPRLTLAAYGYMAELARQAALRLAYEDEIFIEVVVPTQLAPFNLAPIFDSVRQTHHLLTVEEGSGSLGWGAEVVARYVEAKEAVPAVIRRLAAHATPVPASVDQEQIALPQLDDILRVVKEMLRA